MGVDHTAWFGYGIKVEITDPDEDAYDYLDQIANKHKLVYRRSGNALSGDIEHFLCLPRTVETLEVYGSKFIERSAVGSDFGALETAAIEDKVELVEPPGWILGLYVW